MKSFLLSTTTILTLSLAGNATAQTVVADLKAYGTKCGEVAILPNNPLVGKNFTVTTKSKDATRGVIAFGAQRAAVSIGGGCSIYLNPLFVLGWTSKTPGQSTLNFPIPNDSRLLGVLFTCQTAAVNSNGVGFTRGIEGKIGNKQPEE